MTSKINNDIKNNFNLILTHQTQSNIMVSLSFIKLEAINCLIGKTTVEKDM